MGSSVTPEEVAAARAGNMTSYIRRKGAQEVSGDLRLQDVHPALHPGLLAGEGGLTSGFVGLEDYQSPTKLGPLDKGPGAATAGSSEFAKGKFKNMTTDEIVDKLGLRKKASEAEPATKGPFEKPSGVLASTPGEAKSTRLMKGENETTRNLSPSKITKAEQDSLINELIRRAKK